MKRVYVNGNQENVGRRHEDEPAPTILFGHRMNSVTWQPTHQARNSGPGAERPPRPVESPSYTVRAQGSGSHPSGVEWIHDRPATTVAGDPHIAEAGHHERQMNNAVRVTVQEAAILQSFPADYPWQGSRTHQYRQVGDAVPPLMAAAVIGAAMAPTVARERREAA